MGNLAATSHGATHGDPRPGLRPRRHAAGRGRRAVHVALRRADDVHRDARPSPTFDDATTSRTLRTGIMAGSPCPIETMKQVIDRMGAEDVSICYGMTETSPVSTQTRTDDTDRPAGVDGGPGRPARRGPDHRPAHRRAACRAASPASCARAATSVMLGYWDQPDRTAEAIDADGWMHTGDLAVMDADGYVNITGRIKDVVIRGGENIYPREVEEFLMAHPDVARRAGVRRARPAVRRGGHGLDPHARRGRAAGGRRRPRVLPRAARALQGARATCTSSTSSR